MFSKTKSRGLDEEQRQNTDVNKRHYGEDVKFYRLTLSPFYPGCVLVYFTTTIPGSSTSPGLEVDSATTRPGAR